MKKVLTYAIVAVLLVAQSSTAFAVTVVRPVSVSASVASSLDMELVIIQNEGPTASTVSSLNFGPLSVNGTGGLDAARYFTVYTTGKTQTLPYVITQTGTQMTNGTNTMPTGAQHVVPQYIAVDNGGATLPVGAAVGTAGTWVATNKIIYDSENVSALQRTIQSVYALRGDGTLGAGNFVPSNQPAGAYTATITFTMTA